MAKALIIKQPYEFTLEFLKIKAGIPMRTAYIAAVLEKHDIKYDVLDLNIASIRRFGRKKHHKLALSLQPLKSKLSYLVDSGYGRRRMSYIKWILKKTAIAKQYDFVLLNGDNPLSMALMKKIETKKIVGGNRATLDPNLFKGFADYICSGQCDETLPAIIRGKYEPGIIYGECSKMLTPSYKKINLNEYLKIFNYAPIITSLGCPHNCAYCSFKGNFITRDLDEVAQEIRYFKGKGIRNILFYDNHLNLEIGRLRKFLEMLIPLDISWMGLFRPEGLDLETIKLIAESGCKLASFGLETPQASIRKKVKKSIKTNEAAKIISDFKKSGIKTRLSFLYGLPGETFADFMAINRFIKKIKPDYYFIFELQLIKGTDIHDNAGKYFNVFYNNGQPEIIRSHRGMLEHKAKQAISGYSNKANNKKWKKQYQGLHYAD